MLAVWRRGFNGSNPDPNLIARRLDASGEPLGASFALTSRNITNGPFVRPSSSGHWLLTQCARFGFEDRAAPFRIDVAGVVSEDMFIIPPQAQSCGAHDPQGIWTGLRHLVSWTDNSTDELRLAVMDEHLDNVETTLLAPEGDLSAPPRFTIAPDGIVALVAGLRLGPISIWLLGQDGELLGEPTEVEFDIEGESPSDVVLTAVASGGYTVWVLGRWEGGLYRIELDADGQRLEGPTAVPGWEPWLLDDIDIAPAPGGYMLAFTTWDGEANAVAWAHLGADGTLGPPQIYADDFDEFYTAQPRLNQRGDRIFMSYSASLEELGDTFEIRMSEFGCVD
jgi:hypothetical protein